MRLMHCALDAQLFVAHQFDVAVFLNQLNDALRLNRGIGESSHGSRWAPHRL